MPPTNVLMVFSLESIALCATAAQADTAPITKRRANIRMFFEIVISINHHTKGTNDHRTVKKKSLTISRIIESAIPTASKRKPQLSILFFIAAFSLL
jgi:hypothetical protein